MFECVRFNKRLVLRSVLMKARLSTFVYEHVFSSWLRLRLRFLGQWLTNSFFSKITTKNDRFASASVLGKRRSHIPLLKAAGIL